MIQNSDFLIVEDELLIAEVISGILTKAGCGQIRIVSSVEEALREIDLRKPQMVLTDINLGKEKTGIDLGGLLHAAHRIPFIYITSHSSPEILGKAKHTRPNAYIVKPFKSADLLVAIELALFNFSEKPVDETDAPELVVKEGRAILRLNCNTITWMEADGNYTTINLKENNKRRVVRMSLSELSEQLSTNQFIRIHKSYIINKKHVTELKTNSLIIGEQELPIGRSYSAEVERIFK